MQILLEQEWVGGERRSRIGLLLSSLAFLSPPSFLSFEGRGQDRPRATTYLNLNVLKTQGLGSCRCRLRRWEQNPLLTLHQGQAPGNGS